MKNMLEIFQDFPSAYEVIFVAVFVVIAPLLVHAAMKQFAEKRKRWWKENAIYHIYPRSFQDSTGDGNGDLNGITQRLDYFELLGVNILYLSPIFNSPMADNGYDVSDFKDINPLFGNMEDFEALLSAVHERGMKLLLDFVPNHTSDQHKWFLESRSNKGSPKRDWYIWKDPAAIDGGPPNNWVSVFGGSAWSLDSQTKQYYLHQFYKEQPDLNFRNPEVREAMKDVLGFWLDKGVDGFRVDAVPHLLEDEDLEDEPTLPRYDPENLRYKDLDHRHTYNLAGVHEIVREWREFCDQYRGSHRLLIGEVMSGTDVIVSYYGKHKTELDFPLNFTFLGLEKGFTAADIHKKVTDYLDAVPQGKWPNWVLSNHDVQRIGSRVGEDYIPALTVLLLTLPGTAVMYYGDELGMVDADIPAKKIQDFRDPCRTPMQWTTKKNAGFSNGNCTWLPLGKDYKEKNVELQQANPTSVLILTQKLLMLRNKTSAFHGMQFKVVHVDATIFAYVRSHRTSKYLVVMNFGTSVWAGTLDGAPGFGTVVIDSSTIKAQGRRVSFKSLLLHKGQALVIKLD